MQTKEQILTKNIHHLQNQIQGSGIDAVKMIQEIEQELISFMPKANPKIKNWGYNAICFGQPDRNFFLELNVMYNYQSKPYIVLRRIEIYTRNQGYATRIVNLLMEKSKQYGYNGVIIECVTSPAMKHILEKLEFEQINNSQSFIKTEE